MRAGHLGHDLAHQRSQVDRLALQRGMRAREAFAFEQVADQVAHLVEVAQQRLALGLAFGRGGQQLGVEPGPRERRAQLVAQRQQQAALGIEHGLDVAGHGVDALREVAQVVVAADRNGLRELAAAEALRALADVDERTQQPAHQRVGHHHEQQQHAQRGPARRARRELPQPGRPAEDDLVPVGRGAHEPALGGEHRLLAVAVVEPAAARVHVVAGVRLPIHAGPGDADRDRQPVDQRLRAHRVGRRAEFGDEAVGVVHQHRLRGLGPGAGERALHAAHEHRRHHEREHHEHHHDPHAHRAAPALLHVRVHARVPVPAALLAGAQAFVVGGHGACAPAGKSHEEGSPGATASA
ncbi:hypothetical protein D3C71_931050 [compost metagenome]